MPSAGPYLNPEHAEAVEQAIIKRFEEIIALANQGEPPVIALIPDLANLIFEAAYWRLADRCIQRVLEPEFQRVGRKEVPIRLLKRGACYEPSNA